MLSFYYQQALWWQGVEKSTHRTKTSLKRETCTKTCRQGFIINRSIPKWRGLWQSSAGSSPWPALFHTWVLIPYRTAFIKQAARKQNSKALWAPDFTWGITSQGAGSGEFPWGTKWARLSSATLEKKIPENAGETWNKSTGCCTHPVCSGPLTLETSAPSLEKETNQSTENVTDQKGGKE